MDVSAFLGRVLAGEVAPVRCATEREFRGAWADACGGASDPLEMALLGGAIADRLSWVFLSGYQGCLRRTFPGLIPGADWAAFVNTEDPTGAVAGTVLSGPPGPSELSGWKTWVAAAEHVDWLLVSSRQGQVPFVLLPRGEAGVLIEPGPPRGFLRELTQGRVRFERVPVSPERLAGDQLTFPVFRQAESAYVRAALGAFMLSHLVRLDAGPELIGDTVAALVGAAGLVGLAMPSAAAAVGLLGVVRETGRLATEFEGFVLERDPDLHERWTRDRRLVTGGLEAVTQRAAQGLTGMGVRR